MKRMQLVVYKMENKHNIFCGMIMTNTNICKYQGMVNFYKKKCM